MICLPTTCRLQVPLHVKEALDADAAKAAGADGGGGEAGSAETLRFPLALGPARVEAGEPSPANCKIPASLTQPQLSVCRSEEAAGTSRAA